ncbi:type II toxin-antitoxin system VapC family toxin [Neorhizobium petrolearium]|uniref:Ribonuclease VapC n=1 Tax=Xaviernesmea oryzae TaxID=464029 RepID=A0A1X7FUT3_9HYPH|nr:type II toxin-antitoxin system VapC family toxin [Xaviernesmea oryzae]SMF58551.1 Uncharacterized protein, contains PIN domain [Xaviernesmea oryzae]
MFVDSSVVIAILSKEDDAEHFLEQLYGAVGRCTSPLVVLEATMRLTSKMRVDPIEAEAAVEGFLERAAIDIVPIEEADGRLAVQAFREYGKGRGHPAQLNFADCLSYACAKNRGMPLLYKGEDFARTDLA